MTTFPNNPIYPMLYNLSLNHVREYDDILRHSLSELDKAAITLSESEHELSQLRAILRRRKGGGDVAMGQATAGYGDVVPPVAPVRDRRSMGNLIDI
ncbi:hypothetical protein HK101_005224 [Irineochytrium annulatum]|nr:hypothetical protein HK101_005224 [Irineochytrium annulatum]